MYSLFAWKRLKSMNVPKPTKESCWGSILVWGRVSPGQYTPLHSTMAKILWLHRCTLENRKHTEPCDTEADMSDKPRHYASIQQWRPHIGTCDIHGHRTKPKVEPRTLP